MVTVGLSLVKNGFTIVAIAPLEFTFDNSKLTIGSCLSANSAGWSVTSVVAGNDVKLSILSSTGDVIPDGVIVNCSFTIGASASGTAALTFVDGIMSDEDFNEVDSVGTNGLVTIQ